MAIVYNQEQDFRKKMMKFGAKLEQNKGNIENQNGKPRREKLVISKKAGPVGVRASSRSNNDAIPVNLESIKSKVKFARLCVYSTNCLANLSENRFNCDSIVQQGGIEILKQVIDHHPSNPAVMKEVARTLINIAKSNPIYSQKIVENGLLIQCMKTLKDHPNESGIFCVEIMDSVLKSSTDPIIISKQIIQNNGLKILENLLKTHYNDYDLCSSIIHFINNLMSINPTITEQFGNKSIWKSIMNAMKCNPQNSNLAINGIKALQKLALFDQKFASSIQSIGAVEMISNCMQYNPDLKELTKYGANALRLFAGQNDVSRSLNQLINFEKYDNMIISQCLGLLGNLALIEENAQFIVANGGLDCLMNLINYKCKMKNLSAQDVTIVAKSVRAMGRLLEDAQTAKAFQHKGGLNLLDDMLKHYHHEETIVNSVADAIGNLSRNKDQQYVSKPNLPIANIATVICKHPEYNVLMQKFADLVIDALTKEKNNEMLQPLLNGGLFQAIQQSLLSNYQDPDTVESIMKVIKTIVMTEPILAQQLVNENSNSMLKAIQANQNNPKVLAKILDAIYEIGKADINALNYLKKMGLDDQLMKVIRNDSISDETAGVIKQFLDKISTNEIDCDLSNVLMGLKGLKMDFDELNKSIQETNVKSNGIVNQINMHSPLVVPDDAKQHIAQGTVEHDSSGIGSGIGSGIMDISDLKMDTDTKIGQRAVNVNMMSTHFPTPFHEYEGDSQIANMKGNRVKQHQISTKSVGPPRLQGGDAQDDFENYNDVQTLFTKLREARDPKMIIGRVTWINDRLRGGDTEVYNAVVHGGGLGGILSKANENMGNAAPLSATLDAVCVLSTDDSLKQLIGMHGTIRLILEVMRCHSNDIELLDKCCYILSNLSFNNQQNMTAIIELGGIPDIVGVVQKHNNVNFICESAINVLVNLCHNSDKNKVLIARSGGAKSCIAALKKHNRCFNDGDEALVVSCFRCLANLAYVADNVKQLVKLDTVAHVMDTLNQNTDKKDLIQMGVVVLANLSSHERTAARMVNLGVLDLIIKVSQTYPDEMEIQRSCLGCVGNLMNDQANAVTFLDKKGHLRVYEIMQELVFEESVVITALKLLKVLATNGDTATEMTQCGGCKVVAEIMEENKGNEQIMKLGCQALCKMIVTMEAAKYISNDGLCEIIVAIAKENNNWANIEIMNELMKVIVNVSSVEENAKLIAREGGVPLLRSIEAHKTNAVFLNNAAMALTKMSCHPASARPLVKRGAIPVIIESMQSNPQRKGVLARYVRTLTNFLYVEHKTMEELSKCDGYKIVKKLVEQFKDYQPLQTEFKQFEKSTKLRPISVYRITTQQTSKIYDNLDVTMRRFLLQGTIMKKYHENGKSKKKLVRLNDDCSIILFEDPNGQKQPKQLNLKSLKAAVSKTSLGANAPRMDKCNENNSFVLISLDPNGREFRLSLECKTNIEAQKWINGLQDIIQIIKQ